MHHVILDQWSRRQSFLHLRDPRAKLIAVVAFLALVATTPPLAWWSFLGYALILTTATLAARLPLGRMCERALVVVPFSAMFALTSWLSGDSTRAFGIIEKALLSAWATLWLVSTTPLTLLLKGAQSLGVPRLLILILQFLYRYLFVLSEQSQHMRLAARCRGAGRRAARASRISAAAGALGVLFARSYQRADAIHRAMQSRGFTGSFPAVAISPPLWTDAVFLATAILAPLAARLA